MMVLIPSFMVLSARLFSIEAAGGGANFMTSMVRLLCTLALAV
jgi:hypothetical protein